jgi:hypothetical protein
MKNSLMTVVLMVSMAGIGCGQLKGNTGAVGATGAQGSTGQTGSQGVAGENGLSIVSSTTTATATECSNGGTVIAMAQATTGMPYSTSEPNQTMVVVCNGQNAEVPLSIMYPIAPCTNTSSPYKEQLLCLNDGGLLGDFSDSASGLNTRFAFLPTGSYIDTDDSGCQFNVVVNAHGDSTLSYNSGYNNYGTWLSGSITCNNNQ